MLGTDFKTAKVFTIYVPLFVLTANIGLLLTLLFLDFPQIKAWLDAMAADGTADVFNESNYVTIRLGVQLISVVLTFICAIVIFFRDRISARIKYLTEDLITDFSSLLTSCKNELRNIPTSVYLAITLITLFGSISRLYYLNIPIRNDEAFTFLNYVSRPMLVTLSLYDTSNNHILFSVFANICTSLFGPEEWALRLPSFVAGILLIPGAFILARVLFKSSGAGLLAAGLISGAPYLTEYAINARGYSFICLFTTIMLIATFFLIANHKSKIWSIVYILSAAAGFATMPIMAYPMAISLVWLTAGCLAKNGRLDRDWFLQLAITVVAIVALTLVWYSPSLVTGGWRTFLQIGIEKQGFHQWLTKIIPQAKKIYLATNGLLPAWAIPLTLLLVVIGGLRVPLLFLSMAAVPLLLAIQSLAPFVRVLLFLSLLLLVLIAAGSESVIAYFCKKKKQLNPSAVIAMAAVLISLVQTSSLVLKDSPPDFDKTFRFPEAKTVVQLLEDKISADTPIITGVPSDIPLIFYGVNHGMQRMGFLQAGMVKKKYDSLWIVENPRDYKCLLSTIIETNGLDTLYSSPPSFIKDIGAIKIYRYDK